MISYHSSGQDVRTRRADESGGLITFERYSTVVSQSFAVVLFICILPIADRTYSHLEQYYALSSTLKAKGDIG